MEVAAGSLPLMRRPLQQRRPASDDAGLVFDIRSQPAVSRSRIAIREFLAGFSGWIQAAVVPSAVLRSQLASLFLSRLFVGAQIAERIQNLPAEQPMA